MRNVLFMTGIEDSNEVTVRSIRPRGADYLLHGNIDIFHDLQDPRIAQQVIVLGGVAPKPPRVQRPDILFNCISDPDRNRKALALARQVVRTLQVPILNRPMLVARTTRDQVALTLAGIPGLEVPATVRIRPQSHREILDALGSGPVRFPALLRAAGSHGGNGLLLLRSADDAPLLDRIACDGTEYYLTAFVDTRSADGLFRKLRIIFVDGHPFARHRIVGNEWNIHASARPTMDADPALLREEEEFLAGFDTRFLAPRQAMFAEVHRRIGLDFFMMDCAEMADGRVLVFEVNASALALRRPNPSKNAYLNPHVARIRDAMFNMLLRPR